MEWKMSALVMRLDERDSWGYQWHRDRRSEVQSEAYRMCLTAVREGADHAIVWVLDSVGNALGSVSIAPPDAD